MFDYLNYINKIPVEKCILPKVPSINPLSSEFKRFWKGLKRQCIEGKWVEHEKEWKWIPGPIYFYINLWHILLKDKNAKSKTKSPVRPLLRDLEWIKGYVHATARGFSGFEEDDEYSCHRILLIEDPVERDIELEIYPEHTRKSLLNKKGEWKKYKDPLEYLYQYFLSPLGKPQFYNYAKNVVDIESRGGGKSYTMGGFCGHNYMFDGAMDYDEFLASQANGEPLSSETLIGAIDTKYSKDLIGKVQLGLETLEGGMYYNGKEYPSPLEKKYSGSWESGKYIINLYDKKSGGKWKKVGTKSKIQHRSFKDNPFAANGTRPSFAVIDEIGFVNNLEEALGQMAECTADGAEKFGTIWMCGTGGDMAGGSTEAVKSVFYDPAAYDCLEFDDIFEGSTKKIGFFIPAWMTLNQFKDDLGNTNRERAQAYLDKIRLKKRQAKTKQAINDELQQRPIKPSEAFLVSTGNVFPVNDLIEHLKYVEGSEDGDITGQVGELVLDSNGTIIWKPDLVNKLRACHYPMKEKDDKTGAIVIWEHPNKDAGYGYYVAGNDPYDLDTAPNSESLGSTIIMKRAGIGVSNHDVIVAEYTARPPSAKEFFENSRKLLLYYNALCLYENEKNQIKTYFEQKHSLHLLAYTPTVLKANMNTSVSRVYGQHMPDKVKAECEIYLRDWLMAPAGDGKMNLNHIYSIPILQELIGYNDIGNFDRVIALMLAVVQKEQMHHIVAKEKEELKQDPFWTKTLFRRN